MLDKMNAGCWCREYLVMASGKLLSVDYEVFGRVQGTVFKERPFFDGTSGSPNLPPCNWKANMNSSAVSGLWSAGGFHCAFTCRFSLYHLALTGSYSHYRSEQDSKPNQFSPPVLASFCVLSPYLTDPTPSILSVKQFRDTLHNSLDLIAIITCFNKRMNGFQSLFESTGIENTMYMYSWKIWGFSHSCKVPDSRLTS